MPTPPDSASRSSRSRLTVGVLLGALATLLVLPAVVVPRSSAPSAGSATPRPLLGVVQPVDARLGELGDAGVDAAVLSVVWKRAQPRAGALAEDYLSEVRDRYARMRAAGLDVVLQPGLQYTPDWVFDLGPSTRFTDQDGEVWEGPVGEQAADAVHDPLVRRAQADYLARLADALGRDAFVAVRVGGLLDGELRYPSSKTSWWAFTPAAQEQTPVPGWRPGDGGEDEARAFLEDYLDDLADYQDFLLRTTGDAFAGDLYVLYPSWGVRPGEVEQAVEGELEGGTPGEERKTLPQGVDYARQVARLAGVDRAVAYSTWLDAVSQGTSDADTAPVNWLARIADGHGVRLGGENTGDGTPADLRRSARRAVDLGLDAFFWFPGEDLHDGEAPELGDFATSTGD